MPKFILTVLFLWLALGSTAWGCSCVAPGSSCGFFQSPSEVFFLGKVIAIRQSEPSPKSPFRSKIVRVELDESFSPDHRAGETVEVSTGMGGGDCGYDFHLGERYLVNARSNQGELTTGICNRNSLASLGAESIRELRAVAAHNRLPDLTGSVISAPYFYGGSIPPKPLSRIPITLTGQSDKAVYLALTDEEGVFTFDTLPPGSYEVGVLFPKGRTSSQSSSGKPLSIQVRDAHGTGAACHLPIWAIPSGGIAGKVLDTDGHAMKGFVSAYLDSSTGKLFQSLASSQTEADGSFTLQFLEPGRYRIEFMRDGSDRNRWYYPGTLDRVKSLSIEVDEGEITMSPPFALP